MFDDEFTNIGYVTSSAQEDIKHYLYFDHSDEGLDNTLSIKSRPSVTSSDNIYLGISRSQYQKIIMEDCLPSSQVK